MALADDLKNKIKDYFDQKYDVEETSIVPTTDYSKLTFGNKGLTADLTFLFADIRNSSKLHTDYGYANAARIYQSFHDINVRIIEANEGQVRAFDGDRVMGVFSGTNKHNNAVKAAMQILKGVRTILNPKIEFDKKNPIKVGIGIDTGKTLITKVGKGRNTHNHDLVWVGAACNYASHYSSEANNETIISERILNALSDSWKTSKGISMWTGFDLVIKNDAKIKCYKSNYECVL